MTQAHIASSTLDRLSPASRERLGKLEQEMEYPAGAVIMLEGADTPFLGQVLAGRVALRLRVPELGDRVTILTCEPGELIGWSAVVAPYRVTVDVVATERTRILGFSAARLRERLTSDCELAAELLPLVLESVSERLSASWQQLLDTLGTRAQEPW
jgi:CRP/FNR family transcriptional regulator, cyclic AMP receptor protein